MAYGLGALFIALGALVFATMRGLDWGPLVAGSVLCVLGAQTIHATRGGRRGWLARIGPLP